jgi:hypothetical protein
MWRTRVCTIGAFGAAPLPRTSTSCTMWKPAGLRSGSLTSPGFILVSASAKSSGSRSAARQPSAPPCSASGASE